MVSFAPTSPETLEDRRRYTEARMVEVACLDCLAKVKVKKAVNFIGSFQQVLADEARRSQVDGIVCGHIHHAAIENVGDVEYVNTGDWVESCTAVVEHFDGRMELIRWAHVLPEALPVAFVPALVDAKRAEAA